MIHGRAVIDLHNTKTHRDERIVHDNMLTNWIRDSAKPLSPWLTGLPTSLNYNSANLFGGLMMFEHALSNDADDYLFPAFDVNKMIAHADNNVYGGIDLTRGSFNSGQSSAVDGTITRVWDFTQEQGNGNIASLGLCPASFARIGSGHIYDIAQNATECADFYSGAFAKRQMFSNNPYPTDTYCSYFNKDDNRFYFASISAGVLTVNSCNAPLWNINATVQNNAASSYLNFSNAADTKTHDISSIVGSINAANAYCTNDGKMYIVPNGTLSDGSSRTIVIYDVKTDTYTTQTLTNNTGAAIRFAAISNYRQMSRGFVVSDGVLYAATVGSTLAWIDLSDNTNCGITKTPTEDANLTVYFSDNQGYSIDVWGDMVVCTVASGFFFTSAEAKRYVIRKGKSRRLSLFRYSQSQYIDGHDIGHDLNKSVVILSNYSNNSSAENTGHYLYAPALATKNNLESAVTKTADMTMRVTYTVTDSE